MKRVCVVIRDVDQQFEGLRISIGALLDAMEIQMFVLNHEIADMDEAYRDNMEFMDEMKGERYSNNTANVEKYGFKHVTLKQTAQCLKAADIVIPF